MRVGDSVSIADGESGMLREGVETGVREATEVVVAENEGLLPGRRLGVVDAVNWWQ